ncbi:hypothetical protein FRC03_012941 [Tulasnella sp. 419]|nr:hypothetical protein FRC03_012941 [Tulasnella sp. 419]
MPSEDIDQHIYDFLLLLEDQLPVAEWGTVVPSVPIHLFHLLEASRSLDLLRRTFDLERLWSYHLQDYLDSRYEHQDIVEGWQSRREFWGGLLTDALKGVRDEFDSIYNELDEDARNGYAAVFERQVPRD